MFEDVLVTVITLAYNHESYIRDCLNGIMMQNTSFKFELLIHDDASTDNTPSIIREYVDRYPDIIHPIFQNTNQFSQGIPIGVTYLYPRAKGKYIAFCEGDDFWTDPLKLQKQVDFLESHEDYGFVGTYDSILTFDGKIVEDPYGFLPTPVNEGEWELYGDVFEFAKFGPVTRTLTLCLKRSVLEPYYAYICGDIILQTVLAKYSKFAKLKRITSIYRAGVGISSTRIGLQRQLVYNNWYVNNRRAQKMLFPGDCDWDEYELTDREHYLRLKYAIINCRWQEAFRQKKKLRSTKYKKKSYARFFFGPVTGLILALKSEFS